MSSDMSEEADPDDVLRNLFFEDAENDEGRARKRRKGPPEKEKKPAVIPRPTDPIAAWRQRTQQWEAHLTSEKSSSYSEAYSSYASEDAESSSQPSSESDDDDENDPVALMEEYERQNEHIHEVHCPLCRYGAQGRGPSANHIAHMRTIIINGLSQTELSPEAVANQACLYYNCTAVPDIRKKLRDEDRKLGRKRLREPIKWTLDSAIEHIKHKVKDPKLKLGANLEVLEIQQKFLILHCRPEVVDPQTGAKMRIIDPKANALLLRNIEEQRRYWTTKDRDLNSRNEATASENDISDPTRLGVSPAAFTNTKSWEERL